MQPEMIFSDFPSLSSSEAQTSQPGVAGVWVVLAREARGVVGIAIGVGPQVRLDIGAILACVPAD